MDNPLFLKELPVVFLSYDESNADQNYASLYGEFATLVRVHGIKGFDAAHKAAAAQALKLRNTTHFITIDADNEVNFESSVWSHELSDYANLFPGRDFASITFSFRALNTVNAACYGNGGVKLWSHQFVDRMKTHEQDPSAPDFCWLPNYVQLKNVASWTSPGSAKTAFRAGYREGIKLSYAASSRSRYEAWTNEFTRTILSQWTMLGADTEFGLWSICGALVGISDYKESPTVVEVLIDHEIVDKRMEAFHDNLPAKVRQLSDSLFRAGILECPQPLTPNRSLLVKRMINQHLSWSNEVTLR